jgi:uncharacterized protein
MSDLAAVPVAPAESFAPVSPAERISSLDVLRGVAVLGILLMNIVGFGLPLSAYGDPSVAGGATGRNLVTWVITNVFFEGTFRTLFSLLFGAGVVLFTVRAEQRSNTVQAADLYFRRNMWLIVFGVLHGYLLLWVGEILYAYGVTALLLFVFRKVSATKLLCGGLLVLAVLLPKRAIHTREMYDACDRCAQVWMIVTPWQYLQPWQRDAVCQWREIERNYKPTPVDIEQEIALHQSDYRTMVTRMATINRLVQSKWYYRWTLWDVFGTMLLGMALLKYDVLTARRSVVFYVILLVVGYALGLSVNVWETRRIIASGFALGELQQTQQTYDVGRLAVTAGHLGVVMLICRLGILRRLTAVLAAVGRMALTNYVMQSVICLLVFTGVGWGQYGQLERYQLYWVVAAIWAVQLLLSPIWLRFFRFGPLEWLWRCLTYWQLQPFLQRRPRDACPVVDPVASTS